MNDPKYDNWFTDADDLGKHRAPGLSGRSEAALKQARALAQAFYDGKGGSPHWANINRYGVSKDLLTRLDKPDSFDQGQTWLCGIATFVRVWAYDNPIEYVRFAIDMFEKGEGALAGHKKLGGKRIKPSKALLQSAAGDKVPVGDWIVLAPIREAFNDVFDYSADEGIFRIKSWNMPSDVVKEFKAAGYSKIIEKAGWGSGGLASIEEASDLYDKGWRVIILVHSDIISASKPIAGTRTIRTSNHWVGLDSAVDILRWGPEFRVKPFEVYSWNGKRKIPGWGGDIPFSVFNSYYFGYVAALF